jgi:nucleoside-diphosphate-sugar epimerase
MWGKYSKWSMGQLPPAFTLDTWYTQWRKTRYSNSKLKKQVGWSPETRTQDGLRQYFSSRRQEEQNA